MSEGSAVSTWRIAFATFFDFFTIFFVGGFVIAYLFGEMTDYGFTLSALPAMLLIAVIFAYFYLASQNAGGTLWQRILNAKP